MGYDPQVLSVLHRPHDARPPGRAPKRGLGARLALGAGAAAVVAVPFTLLMLLVLSEWEPLDRLDRGVADSLNDVARSESGLVEVLDIGEVAFSPWVFRIVVLAVAVWLWRRGAKRLAAWAVVTIAIGGVLGVVLKLLVDRARPSFPEPVAHASGYSFPSGHALNSAVTYLTIGALLARAESKRTVRLYLIGVAVLLTLIIGASRVYLGVHWPSDVLAGWSVGAAWAVLVSLVARALQRRRTIEREPPPEQD